MQLTGASLSFHSPATKGMHVCKVLRAVAITWFFNVPMHVTGGCGTSVLKVLSKKNPVILTPKYRAVGERAATIYFGIFDATKIELTTSR